MNSRIRKKATVFNGFEVDVIPSQAIAISGMRRFSTQKDTEVNIKPQKAYFNLFTSYCDDGPGHCNLKDDFSQTHEPNSDATIELGNRIPEAPSRHRGERSFRHCPSRETGEESDVDEVVLGVRSGANPDNANRLVPAIEPAKASEVERDGQQTRDESAREKRYLHLLVDSPNAIPFSPLRPLIEERVFNSPAFFASQGDIAEPRTTWRTDSPLPKKSILDTRPTIQGPSNGVFESEVENATQTTITDAPEPQTPQTAYDAYYRIEQHYLTFPATTLTILRKLALPNSEANRLQMPASQDICSEEAMAVVYALQWFDCWVSR
ncbi:hypothetical protein FBEOM_9692 [Fusarium beomiforme]|uniref:Uncharacterized protein n=1 Tax=Fusarium beomiforme TaxID=44412 RepID=A0A9P5ADP6_9HYPO|nr:hypothetical protein FBEOM_9692 [Fusarium beomiforme]